MSEDMKREIRGDNYSLEDILAEYKGKAFIAGERKLPIDEMRRRADEIIREESGSAQPVETAKKTKILDFEAREPINTAKSVEESAKEIIVSEIGKYFEQQAGSAEKSAALREEESVQDDYSGEEFGDEEANETPRPRINSGLFRRRRQEETSQCEEDFEYEDLTEQELGDEPLEPEDEIPENEPGLKDIYRAYGAKARSLKLRCMVAAPICLVLAYIVFAGDFGLPLPEILLKNSFAMMLTILIAEFLVVILGFDIVRAGLRDLVHLKASAETLVTVACIASLMDVAYIVITKDFEKGMPFCAVSACSMFFAMLGAFKTARAYMLTFRAAAARSAPFCITAESDRVEGGCVLLKSREGVAGFVTRCHKPTLTEKLCVYIAPLLILGALGLSLLASVGSGRTTWFFRCFAAMSSVSAPFSLLLVFGHPFRALAKRLSAAGAAIAGWQGTCDIGGAIGLVIKDEDLFPPGTLSISGVTALSRISRDRLVSYVGSIIIKSGSGLAETFSEFIASQRCHLMPVDDFSCFEGGGLSAVIGNDRVLVGSSGFMNLMGIRLQENMNIKNAIFCAINDELSGIFIINYNPTNSVQIGLVSLLTRKILSLFAIRDFNITTIMLKQKFKIPADSAECIEVLSYSERYRLSEPPEVKKQPSAIVCREGLGPYAQTVLGARSLQTAVYIGVVISLLEAVLGLAFMFYMCNKGAFEAATAVNTLIFMSAWLIPILFLPSMMSKN